MHFADGWLSDPGIGLDLQWAGTTSFAARYLSPLLATSCELTQSQVALSSSGSGGTSSSLAKLEDWRRTAPC